MNYLTKKQLSILILFVPLVFKMATLPSLIYKISGTGSYLAIAFVTIAEILQLFLILFIVSKGGMQGIGKHYGETVKKLIAIPLILSMGVKCLVFLTEFYTYVCDYMFYNISAFPIIVVALIVIFYLGLKGVKSVGRLFEVAIWLIPFIFIVGFLFGKVDLKAQYLAPVLENGIGSVFNGIDRYLLYMFDFTPLLFFKIQPKKNLSVAISSVVSIAAVTGCYMILQASYGRATFLVSEAFARLASFNTVVSEIGTLDWPSSLLWLTTALCCIALKLAAIGEGLTFFKIKKEYGVGGSCALLGLLLLTALPSFQSILRMVESWVRYVVIAIDIAVPAGLFILYAIKSAKKEVALETVN